MNQVERTFRDAHGQAVATLARLFNDLSLAEDAVQDAFATAIARWPREGIPANPAGWIVTTARNRAVDTVRRAARGRELYEQIASTALPESTALPASAGDPRDDGAIMHDDQLRLIFTCCHPGLRVEHQVALTLRLVAGLTVEEIARAFLVSEATMAKRLVRAKYKIKAAHIPYRIPNDADLPQRLRAVLSVVYLVYNTGADNVERADLRGEAIRLAQVLVRLMPDESEVAGLLGLMLLSESRVPAQGGAGELVILRDQDRALWDRALISQGHDIVRACIRRGRPGPFQLQAAIQAVHCAAPTFSETDWQQIVALYDQLFAIMPTPVVALNRAIAVAEVSGPHIGLAHVDELAADLAGYHLLHATRGTMLRRLARDAEAIAAFDRAVELAPTVRERDFLVRQREALAEPIDRRDTNSR